MLLFDIVIPTYNNLDELKKCLASFEKQTEKNFKIWVCVDGSEDGTVEFLSTGKSFKFPIAFLEHPDKKNHGRGATLNLSIPHLSAKYLLFLDSDFEVRSDFIELHHSVVCRENVISVGQINYEKSNIWRDYDLTRGLHRFKNDRSKLPFRYMITANTSMLTTKFLSVNGFDENITTYGGEDTDLACSIWEKFHPRITLNKKAIAYGRMEKPLSFALQQREEFAKNNLKYLTRKHPWAREIFRIRIIHSTWGKILFCLTPPKLLMLAAETPAIPRALRIRLVHLLVFYHLYKGYRQNP